MGRVPGFKGVTIAHCDDLPAGKKDKIKNWVVHAGGRHLNEYSSAVTHFIVSKRAWNSRQTKYEPIIHKARQEKSCYLMKLSWLEDSLVYNNGRPINETSKNYAWEPKHAEKVKAKLKAGKSDTQRKAKNEAARRKRLFSRGVDSDGLNSSNEETVDEDGERKRRRLGKAAGNDEQLQAIMNCGSEFGKSAMEFEREMALKGYQPYVDAEGFIYLVTIVRDDANQRVREQYQIKLYESTGRPTLPAGNTQHTPDSDRSASSTASLTLQLTRKTTWASISTYAKDFQPVRTHVFREKRYAVYLQYTKRAASGRGKSNEVIVLAPEGSTLHFAYAAFKKFFSKKTGKGWGKTTGKTPKTSKISHKILRRDGDAVMVSTDPDVNQASPASPVLQGETGIGLIEREPFVYMPLTAENVERFKKRYAKQYNEDWLPPIPPPDTVLGTTALGTTALGTTALGTTAAQGNDGLKGVGSAESSCQ